MFSQLWRGWFTPADEVGSTRGAGRSSPSSSVEDLRPGVVGLEHELGIAIHPAELFCPRDRVAATFLAFGDQDGWEWSTHQYLENGARLYIDCGEHPEYATPECATPQELVAADTAGVRLLAGMVLRAEAALREARGTPVKVYVFRNNVAPNGESWGTHENYQVPAYLGWADLAQGIASHLASRICFSGSGTVMRAPLAGPGAPFRLSQRAPYVGSVVSMSAVNSPAGKPMVLARDEPLADPRRFRRVQVVCGDASMSETATFLKVGTTVIALELLELGALPDVRFDDPVVALQRYSADPKLKATAATSRGELRALDVQWLWVEAASRVHDRIGLPDDQLAVLTAWAEVLADLERDPLRAADRVDWVAKLQLVSGLAARRGLAWDDPQLIAVDLAYHDLHPQRSLHGHLVRSGRMRRVSSEEHVDVLRCEPPAGTRAALRGQLVRELRRCGVRYDMGWARCQIHTAVPALTLELDDPGAAHDVVTQEVLAELRELPTVAAGRRPVDHLLGGLASSGECPEANEEWERPPWWAGYPGGGD